MENKPNFESRKALFKDVEEGQEIMVDGKKVSFVRLDNVHFPNYLHAKDARGEFVSFNLSDVSVEIANRIHAALQPKQLSIFKVIGHRNEVQGVDLLIPLETPQKPQIFPELPPKCSLICAFDQGGLDDDFVLLIKCQSMADIKAVCDAYSKGGAMDMKWFAAPEEFSLQNPPILEQGLN